MKRRDFITPLGGTAAWPLAARAQERLPTPTIGWLDAIDPHSGPTDLLAGFNQGLAEQGYVVGRNVNLEFRSAGGGMPTGCRHWLPTLSADKWR
jgi:putative ABC transport system substrate-binding protein